METPEARMKPQEPSARHLAKNAPVPPGVARPRETRPSRDAFVPGLGGMCRAARSLVGADPVLGLSSRERGLAPSQPRERIGQWASRARLRFSSREPSHLHPQTNPGSTGRLSSRRSLNRRPSHGPSIDARRQETDRAVGHLRPPFSPPLFARDGTSEAGSASQSDHPEAFAVPGYTPTPD